MPGYGPAVPAPSRRRTLLLVAAVLVLVAAAATALLLQSRSARADRAAERAAEAFAAAAAGGALPDETAALVAGLGEVRPEVDVAGVRRDGGSATAELSWRWPFGADGWTYRSELPLTGDGERWQARPVAATVHPDLADGEVLVADRAPAERADVLDRQGMPVVAATPVVEVGVQPSRTTDPAGLARTLAGLLDVDAAGLEERIRTASPDAFVSVVVLRRIDYEPLRAQLQPLPGTVFRESTRPLGLTRSFARALLGTAGPVTAELVEASQGRLVPGDVAGLSGLQRQYDERLAGTAGTTVSKAAGDVRTELFSVPPSPGRPVQLALDAFTQRAADAALETASGGNGTAALVAVDIATGDLLAVAGTPATGADRALTGQYPPGSTFKAATTLALLGDGLTPEEAVSCPPTATVEGRSFRNFEGGALGQVPFATAFAQSCNTAFVSLSERVAGPALPEAARRLGIGVPWSVGVDVFAGEVPELGTAVDLAASSIGQGRTLVSPAAMAQAAATIARGSWAAPRLVLDPAPEPPTGTLPSGDAGTAVVRDLMREVVERGTASALADVPGEPVHAKTGTAEYGTDSPPRTHAWCIGFQGGTAFAVLVEDGASGGSVAVPVAEAFLRGLQATG